MTDREWLELAAKAAGLQWDAPKQQWWDGSRGLWHDWNPLDNDGEALRLAVKLRLVIQHAPKYVVVLDGERVIAEHQDTRENGGDENAATRRAIVRAAASIGEKQ